MQFLDSASPEVIVLSSFVPLESPHYDLLKEIGWGCFKLSELPGLLGSC